MVKNTTGGSKTKGQARKFVSAAPKNTLRISKDELEVYAQVTKNLGNGMCHVQCLDGKTRLCHIRGKFRGRGKRDNFIGVGTWLLVGLREWEASSATTKKDEKLENCDVLEVYNEYDKQRLKDSISEDWSIFAKLDAGITSAHASEDIEFEDGKTSEYYELMEEQMASKTPTKVIAMEDEIDVDDI
jgi:translation initiation factor 1A